MRRYWIVTCFFAFAILLAACSPTTSTPTQKLIQPGDKVSGMVLITAPDQSYVKQDIWSICSPIVTTSDPAIIERECKVPGLPYLFIGLGDVAETDEELLSMWKAETWEMYLDDQKIDLAAFGEIQQPPPPSNRFWNVLLENPVSGVHKLRYIIHNMEGKNVTKDVTWTLTIGEIGTSAASGGTQATQTVPTLSPAIQVGQHPFTSLKAKLNFLLYLPKAYGMDPQIKWPLILFLHGSGKRGANLDALRLGPLPGNLEGQPDFPFIVVSPLLSGKPGEEFWPQEAVVTSLLTLLDEVQSTYHVDTNRVYFTGVSLGGNGVWEIGLKYHQRFAALVPVMGYYGYPYNVPANICDLKDVPIWAFHGAKDDIIPLSAEEGLVNALKACKGNVQFTIYPEGHHDIDSQAYGTKELYTWLAEQKLK